MTRTVLAVALLLLPRLAWAADPPQPKGEAYQQAPAPADGERTVFAAADTPSFALVDPDGPGAGTAVPMCIPFAAMVQLKAKGGEALGTLTMGLTTDMPTAVDATGACYVTDADVAATSGRGSCIPIADGERKTIVVDFTQVFRAPGARGAMCSGTVEGLGRTRVNPPCFDAGDCTASGAGGTCNAASPNVLRENSCAFILLQVDTNATSVTVSSGK